MDAVHPSTMVVVRIAGGPVIRSNWGAFLWNNRDGLDAAELAAIAASLAAGQKYIGGGGAMPVWTVERAALSTVLDAPVAAYPA